MALYGYLQHIQFAGQPAVENYKARARALRTQSEPLQVASNWSPAPHEGVLTLLAPHGTVSLDASLRGDAAAVLARTLQEVASANKVQSHSQSISLGYLDITVTLRFG